MKEKKKFNTKKFFKELEFGYIQFCLMLLVFMNGIIMYFVAMISGYALMDNRPMGIHGIMIFFFITLLLNVMLIVEIFVRNYLNKNKRS